MHSRYKPHGADFEDINKRDPVELPHYPKQYYHSDGGQQQPVPNDHTLVERNQSPENTGEPSQENSQVKLKKGLFHCKVKLRNDGEKKAGGGREERIKVCSLALGHHFFFMHRRHGNGIGILYPFAVIGKQAMPA